MKEDILKVLAEIQEKVLGALNKAHTEVHSMGEDARRELQRLYIRKGELTVELGKVMKEVDKLQEEFDKARRRLAEVSANFDKYGERELKEAYTIAERRQVELLMLRDKEKSLRKERDMIDLRIREFEKLLGKIDDLTRRIKIAIDLLTGNMERIEKEVLELKGRAELAPFVVQALEKERKRLAREIHDGPAQYLANAAFRLDVCERFIKKGELERALKEIMDLKDILKANLSDLRRFISDLRPMLLEDLGLVPALKKYIDDWSRVTSVRVDFKVLGEDEVRDKDIEIALFRIVQEALSNVHKHAQASNVKLILEVGSDFVSLLVQDDGVGFDLEEAKRISLEKGSLGIFNMEERAKALGGVFKILSERGKGVKILVRIPRGGEKA